jgi:folate-binding protein YgfZ
MLSPAPSPFKETPGDTGLNRLAGSGLLACEGADAAAFLQAQTMNDLRALAPGRWQWNGWLTAKGRVICLFALWRRDEQRFLLLLPDFDGAELLPLLQRYVFRSKAKLSVPEGLALVGGFAPAGDSGPARDLAVADGEAWNFDLSGEGGPRHWRLLPDAQAAALPSRPGFDADWRAADLAHGLPRLGAAQREAWTPQMLSLERLSAFSVGKGCYPGQEIVARTHFLGQSKRRLARLQGEGLAPGATVADADGRSVGTVLDAVGAQALAVLSAEHPALLRVEAGPVREAPLLAGLRRPL